MTAAEVMGLSAAWLVAALVFAPAFARALCRRWGLIKPNFQNAPIPSSIGLTFLLTACPLYGLLPAFGAGLFPRSLCAAYLLVTIGFGLLGLLDDKWGSRSVGGFRGHVKAILRGKPTTGSAKLLGGGLLALGAAWLAGSSGGELHGAALWPRLLVWLVDAAVIALGANALNLLDVRPGRALFGFAVFAGVAAVGAVVLVCAIGRNAAAAVAAPGLFLLAPLVLAALREVLPDARARVMLGDTGSNLLGASAGLACVCTLSPWGRVALLVCLLALNALAERVSLSALISKTPLLHTLDRRLGVR